MPSRISALLLAFHAHTWVFGAVYYWLTWALLGRNLVVLLSIIVIIFIFDNQVPWPPAWCTISGSGAARACPPR